jgi:NADH:ubiquinone reductase (H+-translocating)
VVILGGGFAGLAAARGLREAPVEVLLIDRANHHTFQPLLYQVATAGLSAPQVAAPIRHILRRQANAHVMLGEAVAVDTAGRRVMLADGEVRYDYLIVACGVTHSYFGNDHWAETAPGLKTLQDALDIRRRVLLAFERAERALSSVERDACLTFIVVGAGPTGVELAGTLAEIARHTLTGEFRNIDPARAHILLLEGGSRALPGYPPSLSEKAGRQLRRLGVDLRLHTRVADIHPAGVALENGATLSARTIIWAAGVQAVALAGSLPAPRDRAGRVEVTATLQLPDFDDVYVAGDIAAIVQDGEPVPGVAYAAKQMGSYAARAISRRARGDHSPLPPFRYRDRGSLATIGREAAVAVFPGGIKLSGLLAWWSWLFVHIYFLIGFRNRVSTLSDWAWSYVTYQRHARLILGDGDAKPPPS